MIGLKERQLFEWLLLVFGASHLSLQGSDIDWLEIFPANLLIIYRPYLQRSQLEAEKIGLSFLCDIKYAPISISSLNTS